MRRILTVILACVATPAMAQDMGWSTITPSIAGTDTLGLALRGDFGADVATPSGQPSARRSAPPARAVPVNPAALAYEPSLSRRRANIDNFIQRTRQRNTAAGDDLIRAFGSRDILQELKPELDKRGLRLNHVGDAVALYWIITWQASRGTNDDVSRATIDAVKGQVTRALTTLPAIAAGGDAAKQEFAEDLWIRAMLFDASVTNAKGDPKILKMVATAASQSAATLGLNLKAYTLTERGFVPA